MGRRSRGLIRERSSAAGAVAAATALAISVIVKAVTGGTGRMGAVPLIVAATPIGNVDDASPRLRAALASADVIAAEDTRRLRRLLVALGVEPSGRVVSHFDQNEAARVAPLLDELRAGRTVLVVTDAGTPLVSDPGFRLVAAAAAEGLPVHGLPGPSAVTTALAVAGLPADRWCFEGFPPRKAGERRRLFASLAAEPRTLVLFEAPHRLAAMLADLAGAFGGDRRAVVCRELTKTYEEVRRGTLAELAEWAAGGVRGEITIVVAGATPGTPGHDADQATLAAAVASYVETGMSRRDAVDRVATEHGLSRRLVYTAVNSLEP
jgi:16S rRNA (cytidine1402-2'-O)-methyltransferase